MHNDKEQFKFWAFISYSHHDKKVVRELSARIRKVSVPHSHRHLVGGNSPSFSPLYIDEEETAANGQLSLDIQAALRNSRKLIVVCSPFSANSDYVADEILFFKSIGRGQDILCVVASGVPNSTESGKAYLECFSPSLRYSDTATKVPSGDLPLAANLGSGSVEEWTHAVEQLVAGLLNMSLGDLMRTRSRIGIKKAVLVTASFAVLSAVAFYVAWGWFLPHQSYAKNFVKRQGIWEEVDKIRASDAKGRIQSFLFVRRGIYNPPVEVRSVNPFGACESGYIKSITDDDFQLSCTNAKACGVRFTYDTGMIASEEVVDQYNNSMEEVDYKRTSRSDSSPHSQTADSPKIHGVVTSAAIGCSRRQNNVNVVEITRSSSPEYGGYDEKVTFRGAGNTELLPNSNYAYGVAYRYDAAGRVLEKKYLGVTGMHSPNKNGYSTVRFTYDRSGDLTNESFFGVDGKAVANEGGIAEARVEFDANRKTMLETFYGVDNLPMHDDKGIFGRRTSVDPKRRAYIVEYLNAMNALQANGDGVAVKELRVNHSGYIVEWNFLNTQRQTMAEGASGCSRIKKTVDGNGAPLEERCFDGKGQAVMSYNGVHTTKRSYDTKGNLIDVSYWGVDDKPVFCKGTLPSENASACPIHRMTNSFDGNGNRRTVRFIDPANQLTVSRQKIAGWNSIYNSQNFEIRTDYIGPDGRPAAADDSDAIATISEYNALGQKIALVLLDENGKRFGKDVSKFDSRGNNVRMEWYGPVDTLEVWKQGNAGWDREFDDRGRNVKETYFGADAGPVIGPYGSFGVEKRYDIFGREIENRYLDRNGTVSVNLEGYASMRVVRNPFGHPIRTSFYDVLGEPVLQKNGISGWSDKVSNRGDVLERRFFGVDGKAAVDKEGQFHGYSTEYDAAANPVVVIYRDSTWKPVSNKSEDGIAIVRRLFNDRGDIVRELYFDKNAKPMVISNGSFGVKFELDSRGRTLTTVLLGPDGLAPVQTTPFSKITFSYNAVGEVREQRYYDSNGVLSRRGQAPIVRHEYDKFRREIVRSFFSPESSPILAPLSGRSTVRYAYNQRGQRIEEISLGLKGEPVNRADLGWHKLITSYDASGKAVPRCFSASGQMMSCKTD